MSAPPFRLTPPELPESSLPYNTELEFANLPGKGSLSERVGGERGSYDSISFLDQDLADDVELRIGHSTNPDFTEHVGRYVEVSFTHVENPETGRVFHSYNYAYLTWDQIRQIRDYCEFLLKLRPAGGDQP